LLDSSLEQLVEGVLDVQVGVTFPQSEIGADPKAIRRYAQAAEDLGYEHLLAYATCSVPTSQTGKVGEGTPARRCSMSR
jgi:hypothetical protein